jgi:hypothetical protein
MLARTDPMRSRVGFEAGPAANNLGPRAVLRRYAPSATRQRTLEANGIDCGAGPVLACAQAVACASAEGVDAFDGGVGKDRVTDRVAPESLTSVELLGL